MFAVLRRVLGLIEVVESGDKIRITGLPGDSVMKTIFEVWGTNKIAESLFSKVTPSEVEFNRFFAPDVVYAFTRIVNEKRRNAPVRALRKVIALMYEHTWMKDTLIKHPDILDRTQLSQLKWGAMEHQDRFFTWFNEMIPRFKLCGALLGAGPGTGKCSPLDALIKVPGGWATMGSMQIGTKLITPKGAITEVVGVYPQGSVDIYRVTFSDGRSVEVGEDHLWKVHLYYERRTGGYWKIKTTKEILESTSYPVGRAYVPLIESEQNDDIDLPIDPYILGVILGDGSLSGRGIRISKPDTFIRQKIIDRLGAQGTVSDWRTDKISYDIQTVTDADGVRSNPTRDQLEALGLMGTLSYTKFVPDIYLLASHRQRLDLLQGLMDTDGTSEITGGSSFLSTSYDLAKSVQYLVRSLGGMATIIPKEKSYTYNGKKLLGRKAWQVSIRHKYPEDLFSLPRKKQRVSNENQYCEHLKLRIDRIEHVGKKQAQCIAVADEEHLYVTNDFIVTHNTFMGLSLSLMLHADVTIIVCPPRAVKKVWEDTIIGQFKRPAKYWHSQMGGAPVRGMKYYIVHYDFLEKFLAFAKLNHWQRPVILLDESHGMNEIEALRTQLFIELCNVTHCQYVLWESGTPVKALGGEMAPLFRTIDPMFDEDAQRRFSAIYGKSTARANDILAARLGKVTYKVDSNQVVKVEVQHIPLKVEIPNGEMYTLESIRKEMRAFIEERIAHYKSNFRVYERMYDNAILYFERTLITSEQKDQFKTYLRYMKSIRRGYDPKLHKEEAVWCNKYEKSVIQPALPKQLRDDLKQSKSVVKYYQLKVQGEALGQVLGKKRAQCIVDMVPHMGLEKVIDHALKKTLIFTSYVPAVDAAGDYLKAKGYHPLRVYGETNNELAGMVTDFERNEDANPMIATYQSLSSAVPLVMANVEIMMNSPFRSFEYDQAVARVKRLGQDENVQIYDVVLDTGERANISSRTIDIMNWSREQVNEIMGFENAHLIAAESYIGMGLNTEPSVDLTPAVMDEFADNMVLNGWAQEGFMEQGDPFWAQWGTL